MPAINTLIKMSTEIFIPKMGANIEKVTIGKLYVKKGDLVKKGQILFNIVTDKATFDIEADATGTILELGCQEGQELNVLTVVGYIGKKGDKISKSDPKKSVTGSLKITPKARKLAKKYAIKLDEIFFGQDKIIREKDVLKIIDQPTSVKLVEFTPRKKAEISTLTQTKDYLYSSVTTQISTIPLKKIVEGLVKKLKLRLSINLYIYYCASLVVGEFPLINSYYSDQGINLYPQINLGIALNPDDGLIVPIIKDANRLTLDDFTTRFNELVMKAIKNELSSDDLKEGTFTITDLSSYRVLNFAPVVNLKQAVILAIGTEYDSCQFVKKRLIYDPKINLTLAFDHRVIDGKYAAQFLNKLAEKLTKVS